MTIPNSYLINDSVEIEWSLQQNSTFLSSLTCPLSDQLPIFWASKKLITREDLEQPNITQNTFKELLNSMLLE